MKKAKKIQRFRIGQTIKIITGDKVQRRWHGFKLYSLAKIIYNSPEQHTLAVFGKYSFDGSMLYQIIHYSQAKVVKKQRVKI